MDGNEPKFTIVRGMATRLVLKLIDDRNEKEDVSEATRVVFYLTDRPGAEVLTQEGGKDDDNGEIFVDLSAAQTQQLPVGTYLATFELTYPVAPAPATTKYTTERLYAEVMDRVGWDA